MAELYIIMGSNGAGKSSVGPTYLPQPIQLTHTVFDGDKLFMEKRAELWKQGIKANKESKKLAMEFVDQTFEGLVKEALQNHESFVYEGHFTNDATWDIPKKFRDKGYTVHLLYLGLETPELSDLRVLDRAKNERGHYVDPVTVRTNFYGNLDKLDEYYSIAHSLKILDTSTTDHILLAHIDAGKIVEAVEVAELPLWFSSRLPRITHILQAAFG